MAKKTKKLRARRIKNEEIYLLATYAVDGHHLELWRLKNFVPPNSWWRVPSGRNPYAWAGPIAVGRTKTGTTIKWPGSRASLGVIGDAWLYFSEVDEKQTQALKMKSSASKSQIEKVLRIARNHFIT